MIRSLLAALPLTCFAMGLAPSTVRADGCQEGASHDIVDTAVAAGSFKTLATALEAAGLVGALKGEGPFTVFAPGDEAFARLPKGTLEALLRPENKDRLTQILTYHVVPGRVMADQVVSARSADTLNGQRVLFDAGEGSVRVQGARVVKADIACTNGVIHVIDTVILPSEDSLLRTAEKAGSFKTLAAAIKAAGLVEALEGPGPFTVFAPTDEAFAKLPAGTLQDLLRPENKAKLAQILKLHVVSGRVFADQALQSGRAATLEGSSLRIEARGGTARVNAARLVTTDVPARNGVIHVIDTVILPGQQGE